MLREISELSSYLNDNGFNSTNTQMLDFLSFAGEESVDILKNTEFATALSVFISKDQKQQRALPSLIEKYFKNKENIQLQKKKIEEAKKAKENFKRNENLEEEIKDTFKAKGTKAEKELEKLKEQLNIKGVSEQTKSNPTEDNIKKDLKKIAEDTTKALISGNIDEFNELDEAYKKLDKLKKIGTRIKNLEKGIQEEIRRAKKEEDKKAKEIEDALKKALKELDSISKQDTKKNREEFTKDNYKSAVKSIDIGKINGDLRITEANIHKIYQFLKDNKDRFKTKFSRVVNTRERRKLDIKSTIKSACKTGGKPLVLEFEKPKRSKANLVLLLDISGSCSAASKTLMALAHSFKELFPGGTNVYAFVNRLHNISEFMDAPTVEESIDKVFNLIPTKGVYSDYYNPLKSLWEEEQSKINKDSIVFVIGDARNNKNPSGEEYFKAVSRKAKKTIFLNTEHNREWDSGDSIAKIYAKYSNMLQVTNLAELEYAIENA